MPMYVFLTCLHSLLILFFFRFCHYMWRISITGTLLMHRNNPFPHCMRCLFSSYTFCLSVCICLLAWSSSPLRSPAHPRLSHEPVLQSKDACRNRSVHSLGTKTRPLLPVLPTSCLSKSLPSSSFHTVTMFRCKDRPVQFASSDFIWFPWSSLSCRQFKSTPKDHRTYSAPSYNCLITVKTSAAFPPICNVYIWTNSYHVSSNNHCYFFFAWQKMCVWCNSIVMKVSIKVIVLFSNLNCFSSFDYFNVKYYPKTINIKVTQVNIKCRF